MFSSTFNDKLKVLASANPVMLLQAATPLSKTAFRITATHSVPAYELNRDNYCAMTQALMTEKFALVPDTLEVIDVRNGMSVVSGIIEANTTVRKYDEAEIREKMKVITANVFQDEEDNIWTVVESNGNKHLVQSISDDFAGIVKNRITRNANHVVKASFSGVVPASGDYIAYYNTDNRDIHFGFALVANDIHVMDRISKRVNTIDPANILEVVDGNSMPKTYSLASYIETANDKYLQNYLDYARNLFGGTDYFAGLEKLINKRKKWGDRQAYITTYHT